MSDMDQDPSHPLGATEETADQDDPALMLTQALRVGAEGPGAAPMDLSAYATASQSLPEGFRSEAPPTENEDSHIGLRTDGLDEAALRRVVAEVLREELTGPLGDELADKVRAVVRRELQRVLVQRDAG